MEEGEIIQRDLARRRRLDLPRQEQVRRGDVDVTSSHATRYTMTASLDDYTKPSSKPCAASSRQLSEPDMTTLQSFTEALFTR